MSKSVKKIVSGIAIAAGLVTGFVGISVVANYLPEWTVYQDKEHSIPIEMEAPVYKINKNGDTLGQVGEARTTDELPDLIEVEGDNGNVGYMRREDALGENPSSREEAIRMQNERANKGPRVVSVYAEDGVTVIDTFTIGGNTNVVNIFEDTTE